MKRAIACSPLLVFAAVAGTQAFRPAPAEQQAITFDRIRAEGADRSQVESMFATLTDDIGPRLTASPAFTRAVAWSRDRMQAIGLTNAHTESWPFGRGWELQKFTLEMTEPRYMPMIGYPDAWSMA